MLRHATFGRVSISAIRRKILITILYMPKEETTRTRCSYLIWFFRWQLWGGNNPFTTALLLLPNDMKVAGIVYWKCLLQEVQYSGCHMFQHLERKYQRLDKCGWDRQFIYTRMLYEEERLIYENRQVVWIMILIRALVEKNCLLMWKGRESEFARTGRTKHWRVKNNGKKRQ